MKIDITATAYHRKIEQMSKDILTAIAPICKGEPYHIVKRAFEDTEASLSDECFFRLRPSPKRHKLEKL